MTTDTCLDCGRVIDGSGRCLTCVRQLEQERSKFIVANAELGMRVVNLQLERDALADELVSLKAAAGAALEAGEEVLAERNRLRQENDRLRAQVDRALLAAVNAEIRVADLRDELAEAKFRADLNETRTVHWNECPCHCPGPRTTEEDYRAALAARGGR